ncbi:MAG: hypothetical protein Q4A61_06540 [Porphyromonadaceae bacterium]|nr:hypothetical protein [Porphyromonadaceae bacterium]
MNNRRRTAFRYTRQTMGQEPSLIIEMVRLGDDHTVPDIEAIANDGWWNEAKNTRQIAKIILPLNGHKQGSIHLENGVGTRLWSSSPSSQRATTNYYLASVVASYFYIALGPTYSFSPYLTPRFNVRLVKDMDI